MPASKEIPVEELEQEIIVCLNEASTKPGDKRTKPGCNLKHGKACALGTCFDNKPRVTPIDLYNDGMTIWLAGEPGGKIANIMRNPSVSVGIYEPVDHSREQKSLQIWGTAALLNLKNNPAEFVKRVRSFGLDEALTGMIEEFTHRGQMPPGQESATYEKLLKMFNLIKITPEKIMLLHMRPGMFPLRKTWEPGRATVSAGR